MKIIDFEKNGNVVRFFYGEDKCENYWGDDWNDAPYEHNAGKVYNEFIKGYIDVAFDMDFSLIEPADDYVYSGNTPYSKEDMKKRNVPCVIAIPYSDSWSGKDFFRHVGSDNVDKFFFGDDIKKLEKYHIIKRT